MHHVKNHEPRISNPESQFTNNSFTRTSEPISRILSCAIIHLGHPLLDASSDLPGSLRRATCLLPLERKQSPPYLVFLRVGFTSRRMSPPCAVVSYTAFSPLPVFPIVMEKHRRFVFCCTFRCLTTPGCYPAPCPMEFGLSSSRFVLEGPAISRSTRLSI